VLRVAELLGAFAAAGELGRGQPAGHVHRTCCIAMRLADHLGLSPAEKTDVYYTSLLVHAGCTAGISQFAAFIASDELAAQKDFCLCDPNSMGEVLGWLRRNAARGAPWPARLGRMLDVLLRGEAAMAEVDNGCSDVGARVARRLGMPPATAESLLRVCETWNGRGPGRLRGAAIPIATRIVNAAMIVEVFFTERGQKEAEAAAARRAGRSFDPEVVRSLRALAKDEAFWRDLGKLDLTDEILALEPGAPRELADGPALDEIALALADTADLKLPRAAAHSRATATLAEGIARRMRLADDDVALVRRAALVHDVGIVAVPSFIVDKPRRNDAEEERFRLHATFTEHIVSRGRAPEMRRIAEVSAMHHERLDGSGYPRGLTGDRIPVPARILAVADAHLDLAGAEPGGRALPAEDALRALQPDVGNRFDRDCAAALAGEVRDARERGEAPRATLPAGLTEREVEVLRLIARGLVIKEAAAALFVSPHTVRHHLEHIYQKIGVSSRAGAALFAMENGLVGAARGGDAKMG
jgi:HD-GYP domain-containing protein (c-di-GMP phosphodiesterase class II)